jgi:hypothetical protein
LTKKAVDWCYGKTTALGLQLENIVYSGLSNTKDVKSGAMARVQRNKPQWRSR